MIEARPDNIKHTQLLYQENDFEQLKRDVVYFLNNYQQKLNNWKTELTKIKKSGRRSVIWGAGSKAVAFLTTLKIQDEIQYAVDVNPHKQGTYMAGTGQKIVAPDFLKEYKPDAVIIMNPIYKKEISENLYRLGLTPEILTV
jgi:FlaA1/EpsC-like NDP-sugar epimerase